MVIENSAEVDAISGATRSSNGVKEAVANALKKAVECGTSYGAPTELETELAQLVQKFYPSMQVMRMVNSGTEATMSALRVARGFTAREKIVKFIGCYHGHSDSLLVNAGSGAATFGVPSSPGVTAGAALPKIRLHFPTTIFQPSKKFSMNAANKLQR